jgi:hypothetical protein
MGVSRFLAGGEVMTGGVIVEAVAGGCLAVALMARAVMLCLTEFARAACVVLVERSRRASVIAVVQAVPEGGFLMQERPDGGKIIVVRGLPECGAGQAPGS